MEILIRKYQDNDYEIVNNIIKEAFSCEKSNATSSVVNEFVACYDENVVGYFYLLDDIDIVKNIKILHLHYICVSSKYRGLGIANEMMKFIIDYSNKNGYKRIELTSNNQRLAAHKLYEKYGFIIRDTSVYRKELV